LLGTQGEEEDQALCEAQAWGLRLPSVHTCEHSPAVTKPADSQAVVPNCVLLCAYVAAKVFAKVEIAGYVCFLADPLHQLQSHRFQRASGMERNLLGAAGGVSLPRPRCSVFTLHLSSISPSVSCLLPAGKQCRTVALVLPRVTHTLQLCLWWMRSPLTDWSYSCGHALLMSMCIATNARKCPQPHHSHALKLIQLARLSVCLIRRMRSCTLCEPSWVPRCLQR